MAQSNTPGQFKKKLDSKQIPCEIIDLESDNDSSCDDLIIDSNVKKINNQVNVANIESHEKSNASTSISTGCEKIFVEKGISGNNVTEPPCKKIKPISQPGTSSGVKSQVKTAAELCRKLKYKEDKKFDKLLVLILQNVMTATINDLWTFLSYLFPYYHENFTLQQGLRKIRKAVSKKDLFLKSELGNKNLIMLNPINNELHAGMVINLNEVIHPDDLCKPDLWSSLLNCTLNIKEEIKNQSTNSSHNHSASSHNVILTKPLNDVSMVLNTEKAKPFEEIAKLCSSNNSFHGDELPMSDDSNDTVVFEPQITSCCTLTGADSEIFFDDNEQGGNASILGQFANVTFLPNSGSVSFANSVWSKDYDTTTDVVNTVNLTFPMAEDKSKIITKNFPEVDNCLPKWKRIFPWVEFNAVSKTLSCSTCQSICTKINVIEPVVVMSIINADEIFKVSRSLRDHADTQSHSFASILDKKDIISILHFLLSFHFGEFCSVSDILLSFDGLTTSGRQFSNEILRDTIKMLGIYLEQKTWSYLKNVKKFSVITDPCSGLLIVKWLNKNNLPEEHIISSYMSNTDKNPLQFLSAKGVDTNKVASYISNTQCGECNKCQIMSKVPLKSKAPLRLPQLDRYFTWLWRCKLLKPFYALGYTLCKLWFQYPHKFSEIQDRSILNKLAKFSVNPEIIIQIFEHIDIFKGIAGSIYQLSGNLEALGLLKLEVTGLSELISIFPFISAINLLLVQFKFEFPFSKNLDKLLLKRDLLLEHLNEIKDKIKNKKIIMSGLGVNDVDDVLNLVNLVIKEFQSPIYHKCRSVRVSYGRCISYDYLSKFSTEAGVQNDFNILYTALRPNFEHENTVLLKSLSEFLKQHKHLENKDASTILSFFEENPTVKTEYDVAFDFFKHAALLGFAIPKVELCLFEVKIYDLLFYKSAWSNIGANTKEYLLTITSELSGQNKLSERDMCLWWYDYSKTKFISKALNIVL